MSDIFLPNDKNILIISPHLDDAVFSTFGLLLQQKNVKVISIFAGIPDKYAACGAYDRLTRSNNPRERYLLRRAEDLLVMKLNNWDYVHLNYLDKPYRLSDVSLLAISQSIKKEINTYDSIFLPAAIGSHLDHILARDATLIALSEISCDKYLYADLPYASYYGWPPRITQDLTDPYLDIDAYWEESLANVRITHKISHELIFTLDKKSKKQKEAALRAYTSQFSVIEGGPSAWLTHKERISREIYWKLQQLV